MKKTISIIAFILVLIGFLTYVFINSTKETEVNVSADTIEITGMYGVTIDINDINDIDLKDTIPEVEKKVKGSGIGDVLKGVYILDEIGECRLYVHSSEAPYVYIYTNDDIIIINFVDSENTQSLYDQLVNVLGN